MTDNEALNMVQDPNTTTEVLTILLNTHKCDNDIGLVLRHPNISTDILWKFASSEDWWYQYEMLANPNLPGEIIERLARTENIHSIRRIAMHPNTPMPIILKLAEHPRSSVRNSVIKNPSAHEAVKTWIKSNNYAGMTLKEFMEKIDD